MTKKKTNRLSDIVPQFAPGGRNDPRWFLIEHLLINAKTDIRIVRDYLLAIRSFPENANEREIAENCLDIVKGMYRGFLRHYATYLSYLSDTDVPERILRKEL